MAAAKRTDSFFKKVPVGSNAAGAGSSAVAAASAADAAVAGAESAAAAAAGGQPAFEYVLYSKDEFEAVNKCKVGWCLQTLMCHACTRQQGRTWTCNVVGILDSTPIPPFLVCCMPKQVLTYGHMRERHQCG
jgi:hypothetical protein